MATKPNSGSGPSAAASANDDSRSLSTTLHGSFGGDVVVGGHRDGALPEHSPSIAAGVAAVGAGAGGGMVQNRTSSSSLFAHHHQPAAAHQLQYVLDAYGAAWLDDDSGITQHFDFTPDEARAELGRGATGVAYRMIPKDPSALNTAAPSPPATAEGGGGLGGSDDEEVVVKKILRSHVASHPKHVQHLAAELAVSVFRTHRHLNRRVGLYCDNEHLYIVLRLVAGPTPETRTRVLHSWMYVGRHLLPDFDTHFTAMRRAAGRQGYVALDEYAPCMLAEREVPTSARLLELVVASGRLVEVAAAIIARQVLEALEELHRPDERGHCVVHRDVRTENVVVAIDRECELIRDPVTGRGVGVRVRETIHAELIDFGIAKYYASSGTHAEPRSYTPRSLDPNLRRSRHRDVSASSLRASSSAHAVPNVGRGGEEADAAAAASLVRDDEFVVRLSEVGRHASFVSSSPAHQGRPLSSSSGRRGDHHHEDGVPSTDGHVPEADRGSLTEHSREHTLSPPMLSVSAGHSPNPALHSPPDAGHDIGGGPKRHGDTASAAHNLSTGSATAGSTHSRRSAVNAPQLASIGPGMSLDAGGFGGTASSVGVGSNILMSNVGAPQYQAYEALNGCFPDPDRLPAPTPPSAAAVTGRGGGGDDERHHHHHAAMQPRWDAHEHPVGAHTTALSRLRATWIGERAQLPKLDTYNVGLMLFCCCFGRPPFQPPVGTSHAEAVEYMCEQLGDTTVDFPAGVVSDDMLELFVRLTDRDPAVRPTATEALQSRVMRAVPRDNSYEYEVRLPDMELAVTKGYTAVDGIIQLPRTVLDNTPCPHPASLSTLDGGTADTVVYAEKDDELNDTVESSSRAAAAGEDDRRSTPADHDTMDGGGGAWMPQSHHHHLHHPAPPREMASGGALSGTAWSRGASMVFGAGDDGRRSASLAAGAAELTRLESALLQATRQRHLTAAVGDISFEEGMAPPPPDRPASGSGMMMMHDHHHHGGTPSASPTAWLDEWHEDKGAPGGVSWDANVTGSFAGMSFGA